MAKDTHESIQPMFSVVITTYNRADIVKRALKSLITQTEDDWEAIVVDDGSTDDTHARILPVIRAGQRIRYLWKPHTGQVPSKNEGIKSSNGRFITFLDSDDEYHPEHLASRKKILMQNPSFRFLYGGAKILGNQYVPDKNDPSVSIHLRNCVIGGTFVIERELLLSLNGFRNIVLGSDSDLFERAGKAQIPMAEVKTPTYIYHHEGSDSVTNKLFDMIKPFR
ncbi:MAG: glycosyltransferase [Bacteroidales bacterium]|nr:glycosyltransferase [Bacteroidales bacterium]MBN2762419.1 glycosyltransferase [Bacteroidales bacterium]